MPYTTNKLQSLTADYSKLHKTQYSLIENPSDTVHIVLTGNNHLIYADDKFSLSDLIVSELLSAWRTVQH